MAVQRHTIQYARISQTRLVQQECLHSRCRMISDYWSKTFIITHPWGFPGRKADLWRIVSLFIDKDLRDLHKESLDHSDLDSMQ